MEEEHAEQKIPIWLDCDPGHDDAFAILLAAHHPCFRLLGVSTVHGNASLDQTTANASSIFTAIGRANVPVYAGASKPFCRNAVHAPDIHGATGLDGTTLLPSPMNPPRIDTNAILAARTTLLTQPEGLAWVIATGALTNVALLFSTFPEIANHIKGLSIMGGAIGGNFTNAPMGKIQGEGERVGNWTKWAEFNIYCDPEAAKSILSNPMLTTKTVLITLDLTHQVLATPEVLQSILHGNISSTLDNSSTLRQLLYDLLTFFATTYAEIFGLTAGPPLHDPLAVAVALCGLDKYEDLLDLGTSDRWIVDVITEGEHSDDEDVRCQLGHTAVRKSLIRDEGIRIPRSVNVGKFWDIIEICVKRAESSIVLENACNIARHN